MTNLGGVWVWTAVAALMCSISTIQAEAAFGRKIVLGGRREIKGVKSNEMVQELGRFCVSQYNNNINMNNAANGDGADDSRLLSFSEVLEAERQVVAGMKYYLKISAASVAGGVPETYEAVVVVKPWLSSKRLLTFAPSSPPTI